MKISNLFRQHFRKQHTKLSFLKFKTESLQENLESKISRSTWISYSNCFYSKNYDETSTKLT